MQMEELRKQWITSEKEYREGEVFVYPVSYTHLDVYKRQAQTPGCSARDEAGIHIEPFPEKKRDVL